MNNDKSPFGSPGVSPLDRAIDRAVREMMEVDPPAGLSRRVLARINAPAAEGWTFLPRYAAAAAALAMLVLAVIFIPRSPGAPAVVAEPPAAVAAGKTIAATPPAPPSDAVAAPKTARAGAPPRSAPHREPIVMPRISNVFGPRGRQVSAANAQESAKAADAGLADTTSSKALDRPTQPFASAAGPQKPAERVDAEALAAAAAPAGEASRGNVNIELTVVEDGGTGEPVRKTVTMLVADRQNGSIRSRGVPAAGGARAEATDAREDATLNVDATPTIYGNDSVLVLLTIEYLPGPLDARSRSQLHERMRVMVTSGKPIVISQASDPVTSRRTTVELKATVLR